MKKTVLKIVSLLLCLMIGLVAFACQPTPPDDGNLDEIDLNVDPQIEAELRIAVKNDKAEIDAMQKVMDAFQELYPNVTYDLVPITDYEATIMGDVASGLVYDVMWAADAYVTLFADEDLLLNLDTFIEKSGFDKTLYYDSLIRLGQYTTSIADIIYGTARHIVFRIISRRAHWKKSSSEIYVRWRKGSSLTRKLSGRTLYDITPNLQTKR